MRWSRIPINHYVYRTWFAWYPVRRQYIIQIGGDPHRASHWFWLERVQYKYAGGAEPGKWVYRGKEWKEE